MARFVHKVTQLIEGVGERAMGMRGVEHTEGKRNIFAYESSTKHSKHALKIVLLRTALVEVEQAQNERRLLSMSRERYEKFVRARVEGLACGHVTAAFRAGRLSLRRVDALVRTPTTLWGRRTTHARRVSRAVDKSDVKESLDTA